MTRDEADAILLKAVVGRYPTTYNGTDVIQVLLEIFNDKEELEEKLKDKDEEIKRLKEYMEIHDELHLFKLALNETMKEIVIKPLVKDLIDKKMVKIEDE